MPTPNAQHRSKQPNLRRPPRSSFLVLLALVISLMAYAAGAVGVAHIRDAAAADDTGRPTMPKLLRLAQATSTTLTLSWRPSYDNVGVVGYDVYVTVRPTIQTTRTSYRITGLACRTTYRVGVAAYDAAGNRSRVAWVSASTTACAAISATAASTAPAAAAHPSASPPPPPPRTPNRLPSRSSRWGRRRKQPWSCAGSPARTTSAYTTTTFSGGTRRPSADR